MGCICCWETKDHFRGNFWRRIWIRNQNQPITSGFLDIWGYVLKEWGFSLLLRLCTGCKKFFLFFSQMSSFSTTLSFKNELLNSHKRFFPQRYGHIKFWHLSEQPYEHSHWLFGAYHSAFNLSWKFAIVGFDRLWIRIYSHKIDISISKMVDSKWRIKIYESKRFPCLMSIFWL